MKYMPILIADSLNCFFKYLNSFIHSFYTDADIQSALDFVSLTFV